MDIIAYLKSLPNLVIAFGLSFIFLCIVFWPLERAFPARPGQRFIRPAWFTDLCFFGGQYILWNGVVLSVLLVFKGWLDEVVPSSLRAGFVSLSFWTQTFIVLVL